MKYRQCKLQKFLEGKIMSQTCYIPNHLAVINKDLKIKENESWDYGWIVSDVYGDPIIEDLLPDSHKAIKLHRSKTGDSLKK